ncbi:LysR family transcriptional regulator (plasmid) [Aminobacter sp. SR38]|jgi:DNA-binding transcriptional LysR family regulator|uniref:LysR family transcriptional regulator n=1 Tax=Aminobacter sp. SR38 TaxID=2774562 RepID=UPI001780F5A6|nr:LysR family transcriptional regulator [Aminobacter sp. SR38]QOF75088.1 LysR family transcriptional regulator [Aminobacter sp. SR38]
MKNYRRTLPPLDYLLFFEAAARHRNFTRAAAELNVSQAAVSKRVKVLENWLGITLVNRHGRNIGLSQHGESLAATTAEALDYLNTCLQRLSRTTGGTRLSLAANVAVSQFWLMPRINEYLLGHDPVPVTLTSSDKDAELLALDIDAILYYGSDIPPGWGGLALFEETWLPVASPLLRGAEHRLGETPLLDFDKLTPKWINWSDFVELTGHTEFIRAPRVNLGSYSSTLDTAIRGKGIALGCPEVLSYEIEAGRLIPLYDYQLKTGRSYFVIWRSGTMTEGIHNLLSDVGISFKSPHEPR